MSESPKAAARRLALVAIREGFSPEALHEYRSQDGSAIYWRIRAKHADGRKWIRPMRLNGHGYELGEPDFPDGKPLYHLDRITANPASPVWIVEGEKAADALTTLGAVATTSGGADSADRADWTPLRGRECRLWRDNDEAGTEYAGNVAAILSRLECQLSAVDIVRLGLPLKGDAWDWMRAHENATLADLYALPMLTPLASSADAIAHDSDSRTWPAAMDEAALHGIAGEFVRMIEPDTEADPAALLIHFFVCFGAMVGREGSGPHFLVERDKHHANLYAIIVGASATARKGTARGRVVEVFKRIPEWKAEVKGLSTGEGLIHAVRDPREGSEKNKLGELVTAIVDPGVADKRLLVIEPEFARVLKASERQGNILSTVIRDGWDSGDFRTLTKSEPATATNAHVCIIGHITAEELRAELTATDTANGFANRFLFVAAKRSKFLALGSPDADEGKIQAFADRLRERMRIARTRGRITMTPDAVKAWIGVYPELSAGGDGLHGAATARAAPQVLRLALVYCLLDGVERIGVPHLLAGLAVWQYCDDTARYIFGASLGDRIADELLRQLQQAGDAGMTRTEIRDAFKRHQSAERIGAALELLRTKGLARCETRSTGDAGGRPAEVWRAVI